MKTIRLVFNKDLDDVSMLEIADIISELKRTFNVIEDDNGYSMLRYIEIDAEHLVLGTYPFISIQDITKPHLHVGIYNKYLYKVELLS